MRLDDRRPQTAEEFVAQLNEALKVVRKVRVARTMTSMQSQLFALLVDGGPKGAAQLGSELGWSPAEVAAAADALSKAGFVLKHFDHGVIYGADLKPRPVVDDKTVA